ncbi:MAG: hypothetical protein ACXWV5_04945 [Flavitalea sp.]
MSNKSSKSPSGEERDQPVHLREDEITRDDIEQNTEHVQSTGTRKGQQENLSNRGYEEDQPGQPVRNTGKNDSTDKPAGEPEEKEQQQ